MSTWSPFNTTPVPILANGPIDAKPLEIKQNGFNQTHENVVDSQVPQLHPVIGPKNRIQREAQ